MKLDTKEKGKSPADYEVTLNATSKVYSQRTVESNILRDLQKEPKFKAIRKTKQTKNNSSEKRIKIDASSIENPELKDFPTENIDLAAAVLPDLKNIQSENSDTFTYQGKSYTLKKIWAKGFTPSNHVFNVQSQDSDYAITPKELSSDGSVINHSNEQLHVERENTEQSSIQTDKITFERKKYNPKTKNDEYQQLLEQKNNPFYKPMERVVTLEMMIKESEKALAHYLGKDRGNPHVNSATENPVLSKITNDKLREAITQHNLLGMNAKTFQELYLDELFKIGELSPSDYRHSKYALAFPDFKEPYPFSKSILNPIEGEIDLPETFQELISSGENGLSVTVLSNRKQAQTPESLVSANNMPLHAYIADRLNNFLNDHNLAISKVILRGDVFPTYIIEKHINDSSHNNYGRTIRIQVSDVNGTICFDDGLTGDSYIKCSYGQFVDSLYPLTKLISHELEQQYLDFMLITAVLARSVDLAECFLKLGANPNNNLELNYSFLNNLSGEDDTLEGFSFERFAHVMTQCEAGFIQKQKERKEYPSALLLACIDQPEPRSLPLIEKLIEYKADVNSMESSKFFPISHLQKISPLYLAIAIKGDLDLVNLLIENNADLFVKYRDKSKKNTFYTPLDVAINHEAVRLYNKSGRRIDAIKIKEDVEHLVYSIQCKTIDDDYDYPISILLARKMLEDPKRFDNFLRYWEFNSNDIKSL